MRSGVLVGAGIATADPATFQAHPQMCPHLLAQCRAVFALTGSPGLWILANGSGQLGA